MPRPAPSSVIVDGQTFYAGLLAALPDAGNSVLGPAPFDDDFDGSTLSALWTTYNPGTHVLSVSGGFRRMDATGAVGFTAFPNRTPGPRDYQEVTGDFDIRLRVQVRNDADSAEAPQTAFRYACLYVSAAESTAVNWLEIHGGVTNSAPTVRVGTQAADGAGGSSDVISAATTTTHLDLRIVREGQLFTTTYRETDEDVALSDPSGWIAVRVIDKTLAPMPDTVMVGPMMRANSGVDTLAKFGEFVLMPQETIATPIGDRFAVSKWRASGDAALNGATASMTSPAASTSVGWGIWDAETDGNLIAFGSWDKSPVLEAGEIVQVFPATMLIDGANNYAVGLVQDLDLAARVRSRLWTVVRKQPKFREVADWLSEQMQQADSIVTHIKKHGPLAGAYGSSLDTWGALFGLRRLGQVDDRYREAIILKAASLAQRRTGKLVRQSVATLIEGTGTTSTYREYAPAAYEVELRDIEGELAAYWTEILAYLKPDGVRFTVLVAEDYTEAMLFDGAGGSVMDSASFLMGYTLG